MKDRNLFCGLFFYIRVVRINRYFLIFDAMVLLRIQGFYILRDVFVHVGPVGAEGEECNN